tara:strand:- start:7997 stop:9010 length:1014 start_codon:yes stop_codon:yes gene_type:complete
MKEYLKEFLSAYLISPKKIELIKNKVSNLEDVYLIIKVNSCMICGSDIRIFKEGSSRIKVPRIIGHETSGTVVLSKINKFKVGDKVSLGADIEKETNFAFGYEIDGGFSQYIFLNKKIAKKAPISRFRKNISFDEAALAEPLACCINGIEKVSLQPKKVVTIFGAGPIGLMIALLAQNLNSKKIFIVDVNSKRLQQAKKILKCNIIQFNKKKFVKEFYKRNNNMGSDYIFTANPSVESHKYALKIASKNSSINFFGGVSKNNSKLEIDSNFVHYNEIQITGSHGSTHLQHKKALRMIENKKINLKPLITHKFNLKDIKKAYEVSLKGKSIKVSIRPN